MNLAWPRWTAIFFILALASSASAQQNKVPPRNPPPAAPPPTAVSTTPQMTTATYGDWVLRCQVSGDPPEQQHVCEVAQTLQVQGTGPIAQIVFGRTAARAPLLLTVILPTNVTFPSSVLLSTDEKDTQPAELGWQRCLPAGCIANGEVKDDLLRRWRPQTGQGRLQFKEGDGRDIMLAFSFRGLAQALDAMAKI